MSLLNYAFTACTMLDKTTVSDGRGGIETRWVEGAGFMAAVEKDSTAEMRVAEAQGVKSVYMVTTTNGVVLDYHDIFRREDDGKIFRITGDGADTAPPGIASEIMKQISGIATAEEWALPSGGGA